MGLDGVELVMAVEEEFSIRIEDADAAGLKTPRQLADYILARIGTVSEGGGRCLSQAAFYRIRAALVRHFGAQRSEITADSDIRAYLTGDIRQQWDLLGRAIGARALPALVCKRSVYYPLTLGVPSVVATLLGFWGFPLPQVLAAAVIIWLLALLVAVRIADQIPENLIKVRTLVPYAEVEDRSAWTAEYVLRRVIFHTSVQLGIPLDKIRPDHEFVRDLGMDR